MSAASEFPAIAFNCPKVWSHMQGDERTRHCEACHRQVHNLSLMTQQERRALLSATGESPCVAYFQHVNGRPIDVTALPASNPLKHLLSQAAAVSLGSMAMMTGCSSGKKQPPLMMGVICPPSEEGAKAEMPKKAGQ